MVSLRCDGGKMEDLGYPAGLLQEARPLATWLSISLDPALELPSAWDCLCPHLVLDSGTGLNEEQKTVGAHGDSDC